jgi:hypothetical protein
VFSAHDAIWSIFVPAGIALLILLASRLKPGAWWLPSAFGAAFLIAFPGIRYEPWQIPALSEASNWLWIIGGVIALLAVIDSMTRLQNWARTVAVFVIAAIAAGVFLKFKFRVWTPAQGTMMLLAGGALAALWWVAIESAADEGGGFVSILGWLIGVGICGVILPSASHIYGKLGLLLAAVSGALLVACLLPRSRIALRGFSTIYAIMAVLLLAGATYLSDITPLFLWLLASTPLFILIGHLVPVRLNPWVRNTIRLILVALPLFTAVTLAIIEFNRQPQDDSSYYYK